MIFFFIYYLIFFPLLWFFRKDLNRLANIEGNAIATILLVLFGIPAVFSPLFYAFFIYDVVTYYFSVDPGYSTHTFFGYYHYSFSPLEAKFGIASIGVSIVCAFRIFWEMGREAESLENLRKEGKFCHFCGLQMPKEEMLCGRCGMRTP